MSSSLMRSLAEGTIQRTVLDNGIVVITVENPAADIIAGRIFIKAGSRWEPEGKSGLFHLMSTVLTKGTEQLSSLQIADLVESVGASLGSEAASDYFLVSLKTVSADFVDMFHLAGQLLRSPTFPEAEVELERRLTIQDIRSQQEQPLTIAFEQLRQAMYQNHPYAQSILGTEASVAQITRADLQHYHKTFFRPDNIVISLTGRIAPDAAVDLVNQVFGDWKAPDSPLPVVNLPNITAKPTWSIKPLDTQQSIVMLGYLGPEVQHPDYGSLKLLSTYLGNGLSSRLFVELREKRGLAYEVSAFYPTRLEAAQFVVYMGTAPYNTEIALEGLRTEVERLCKVHLIEEELVASKNKLLGQYALGKQTNAQIAQVFGWYEILGLGIDFDTQFQQLVNDVTPEMAQQAARQYLSEPYVSIVGPEENLRLISA